MSYAYETLMAKHGLTMKDLPADALHGIEAIKNIEKAMHMAKSKGHAVSDKTIAKLKANDKWVVGEILDHMMDKDDNEEEIPHEASTVIKEINQDQTEPQTEKQKQALVIVGQLDAMFKTGKTSWNSDELKASYKDIFEAIRETYKTDDKENGISTANFSLIENPSGSYIFTLQKK